MRKEIGAVKERGIGWLMAGGLALLILCTGLIGLAVLVSFFKSQWEGIFPGIKTFIDWFPAYLYGAGAGIAMMVLGLGYGLISVKTQTKGPRKTHEYFRILSRYCLDKNFNLIHETSIDYVEKPKFYLRAVLPNGMVGEFETTIEVFFACGEGMYGEAEIQGNWVGRFIPYIGDPTT